MFLSASALLLAAGAGALASPAHSLDVRSPSSHHHLAARSLPSGWSRVGCITDKVDARALGRAHAVLDNNSATNCINFCASKGLSMAGVEYGNECWCGNTVGTLGGEGQPRPDSECEVMSCPGWPDSKCGAGNRMIVFKGPSGGGSSGGGSPPSKGSCTTKGLAWSNPWNDLLHLYKGDCVSLLYTWSSYCPKEAAQNNILCMPMLWGGDGKRLSQWKQNVHPGQYKIIMGFNEPNEHGQSNMSPGWACSVWRQYISPLQRAGAKVVSPATTCGPDGLEWMKEFVKECPDAHFDYLALHWYNDNFADFQARLTAYHNAFPQYQIWVTEFADQNWHGSQPSYSAVKSFMYQAMAWMDRTPWVGAYFPFGILPDMQGVNKNAQLVNSNGTPNELGRVFLDFQA